MTDNPNSTEPNPVEWISLKDKEIPMYRRMNCRYYSKCLLFAALRRWLGFSCKECKKGGPK